MASQSSPRRHFLRFVSHPNEFRRPVDEAQRNKK